MNNMTKKKYCLAILKSCMLSILSIIHGNQSRACISLVCCASNNCAAARAHSLEFAVLVKDCPNAVTRASTSRGSDSDSFDCLQLQEGLNPSVELKGSRLVTLSSFLSRFTMVKERKAGSQSSACHQRCVPAHFGLSRSMMRPASGAHGTDGG